MKGEATVPAASRGYDAGKKINGRKRHIAVDTLGLLLVVMVTAASVSNWDTGRDLLQRLRARHRAITLVWADGGYTNATDSAISCGEPSLSNGSLGSPLRASWPPGREMRPEVSASVCRWPPVPRGRVPDVPMKRLVPEWSAPEVLRGLT
ncbi:transposase [Streptomyces olivochromogenes]|uniref:transposase n=1 Tax=Streptomyces olivochromogenes TaxID=1963 RepID=UPI00367F1840